MVMVTMVTSVCLLLVYVLAPAKVISGRLPAFDSAHSRWTYSPTPLGNQAVRHRTLSVTLSWHWTNPSLPFPNHAERLARKRRESIVKSLVWLNWGSNYEVQIHQSPQMGDGWITHTAIPSGRQPMWWGVMKVWNYVSRAEFNPTLLAR